MCLAAGDQRHGRAGNSEQYAGNRGRLDFYAGTIWALERMERKLKLVHQRKIAI
jgi:hypothetical protein